MPADPPPTNAPEVQPPQDMGPLGPKGVLALKIAVVVMALMIFAGMALIVGRIIYLASGPTKQQAPGAIFDNAKVGRLPPKLSLAVPKDAAIQETRLSGDRLLVRYTRADGASRLAIYDMTSGARITSVEFKRVDEQ